LRVTARKLVPPGFADSTGGQRLCYCFEENEMGNRLYVGNLSYNVTEAELKEVFAEGERMWSR